MFPLSRIFFLRVKIDPARFQVKRFVKPYTSRLRAHATIRLAALLVRGFACPGGNAQERGLVLCGS
jgi:hypothetical protein